MLTRRRFGACALCAAFGLAATAANAQSAPGATGGVSRTILQRIEYPGDKYVTILVSAEIGPGAIVARHTHPGVESAYIMEGEGVLSVQGQPDRTVKAADSFQIPPETPHGLHNGPTRMRIAGSYVVEKDKPLASPAPG